MQDKKLTFQEMILRLQKYWGDLGCIIGQPYGVEVGAGTANPHTFFRALGPEPYSVAYVEPSRRPADGRYGENPNRLQHYYQFQVILKPAPANNIELYIESLRTIGINPEEHDLRFVEDNWESAPLGAWGLGWEVWLDGMEISQYTYFQQFAGLDLPVPCVEITFGLERLAMYIQGVDDYKDLMWNDTVTYGEIFKQQEFWQSKYNFETADVERLNTLYNTNQEMVDLELETHGNYLSAYDHLLKMSHLFNLLDARGVVSLSDRTARFKKMGGYARGIGKAYLDERKELGFPLMGKEVGTANDSIAVIDAQSQADLTGKQLNLYQADDETYLLELGFEEIPSKYLIKWLNEAEELRNPESVLRLLGAEFEGANLFITPRRIVLLLSKAAEFSYKNEVLKGPLYDLCYENGEPTAIMQKFLKSYEGMEYEIGEREENGRKFVELRLNREIRLENVIEQYIELLVKNAPRFKFMKWQPEQGDSFIRPLRWILSMQGSREVSVSHKDVSSGSFTKSPRYLMPATIRVESAAEYLGYMNKVGVVLDHVERYKIISDAVAVSDSDRSPNIGEYIELNSYLTEAPLVHFVKLEERFEKLPSEVVTAILEEHQKYLIRYVDGRLQFGIVLNGLDDSELIVSGNLKVARARLEDGLFYFGLDVDAGMPTRESLKRVIFHQTLGESSYYSHVERVERLAGYIWTQLLKRSEQDDLLTRAISNFKIVKSTKIVQEFPTLERDMMRYFVSELGNDHEAADILFQSYMPSSGNSESFENFERSAVIAIADNVDKLVALATTDSLPTGSNDPFEARKAAYQLLDVLYQLDIDVEPVIRLALDELSSDIDPQLLLTFINQRLYQSLKEGASDKNLHDLAISGVAFAKSGNVFRKNELLAEFKNSIESDEQLFKILDTFKRVKNILKGQERPIANADESLFRVEDEHTLLKFIQDNSKESGDDFLSFSEINRLSEILEGYFNNVKVMDDNEAVRNNRLNQLAAVEIILDRAFLYQP